MTWYGQLYVLQAAWVYCMRLGCLKQCAVFGCRLMVHCQLLNKQWKLGLITTRWTTSHSLSPACLVYFLVYLDLRPCCLPLLPLLFDAPLIAVNPWLWMDEHLAPAGCSTQIPVIWTIVLDYLLLKFPAGFLGLSHHSKPLNKCGLCQ